MKNTIHILKLEALQRKLEAERLLKEYESAVAREKAVHQAAIDAGDFRYDAKPYRGDTWKTGDRIRNGSDAYLMSKEAFQEYLVLLQKKWKELFNLDYPINYTPTFSEFKKPYLDALKQYRLIAADFLEAFGQPEEAAKFRDALNGYLPERFAKQIDDLNEQFIRA